MDEPKDSTSVAEAGQEPPVNSGQNWDVQAPKTAPAPDSDASAIPVTENNVDEPDQEVPVAETAAAPGSAVEETASALPENTPVSESTPPADTPPVDPPQSPPSDTTPDAPAAAPPAAPKKHGAPVVAILLAVIVAVALAGVAVFMYLKSKNAETLIKGSESSTQTVVEKPQASPSDVDTTTKEIDDTLTRADDAADFSANELSDTSLGL